MVLYEPHVELDEDEARALRDRLKGRKTNDRAVEALRRARASHS